MDNNQTSSKPIESCQCLHSVSKCCNSIEHPWFPLLCNKCRDFSDFICKDCSITLYKLPPN